MALMPRSDRVNHTTIEDIPEGEEVCNTHVATVVAIVLLHYFYSGWYSKT
jgi:hypothetical protein